MTGFEVPMWEQFVTDNFHLLDYSNEAVSVEEDVHWLLNSYDSLKDLTTCSRTWILEAETLDCADQTTTCLCDANLFHQVTQCKNFLNGLEENDLEQARSQSNPFETIKGGFFQNRAAMKIANLDAVFDWIFTNPKTETGELMVHPDQNVLYFADVCGGPGGFSEYVLWRKKWGAKGFGFTLKCSNDFNLHDMLAGPSECLDLHYGHNGINGDGDIYKSENIAEFSQYVNSQTDSYGVHVVMSDGGFSVDGNELFQEILSKQLYLCQCLMALNILREGGHFVCKFFDIYTPFSVGLLYLMYRCFRRISIHKPNSSRRANSERYLVCKWKKCDANEIIEFLSAVNKKMNELKASNKKTDIYQLVPLDIINADQRFVEYLTERNNIYLQQQIAGLAKVLAYCRDKNLREHRQTELKIQCLEFWDIPNKPRAVSSKVSAPDEEIDKMITNKEIFHNNVLLLSHSSVFSKLTTPLTDWMFTFLELECDDPMRTFFLGLGRDQVFYWNAKTLCWARSPQPIELPKHTLLYGELVQTGRFAEVQTHSLQVIDAVFIGGLNVSYYTVNARRNCLIKLTTSVNKLSRPELVKIQVKSHYLLVADAKDVIPKYFRSSVPIGGENSREIDEENIVLCNSPVGLLIFKPSKSIATTGANVQQTYALCSFFDCFVSRIGWWSNTDRASFVPLQDLVVYVRESTR